MNGRCWPSPLFRREGRQRSSRPARVSTAGVVGDRPGRDWMRWRETRGGDRWNSRCQPCTASMFCRGAGLPGWRSGMRHVGVWRRGTAIDGAAHSGRHWPPTGSPSRYSGRRRRCFLPEPVTPPCFHSDRWARPTRPPSYPPGLRPQPAPISDPKTDSWAALSGAHRLSWRPCARSGAAKQTGGRGAGALGRGVCAGARFPVTSSASVGVPCAGCVAGATVINPRRGRSWKLIGPCRRAG